MPTITASTRVEDVVAERRGDLIELSHSIHAEPELAFNEHRSCAKTQALVAERGFRISAAPGGLPTAFRADYGSGPLVIGICAEYDALPGIGHACGHNIIAASAVGTALALAEVADDLGLTVALIGTPAEESGGGKALLIEAGVFDDVAAAVMLHPGPIDIAAARSLSLSEVTVTYTGRESHAAVAPYLGVNAADAVTVAQVAIGLLRQQMAPGQMAHGIVTEGGSATNVIPGRAKLQYTMRATDTPSRLALEDKMRACFEAGAVATGCQYEIVEAAPAIRRTDPGPLAGRGVPRRDGPARTHARCPPRWRPRCRWAAPTWATSPNCCPASIPWSASTPGERSSTSPASPRRPPVPAPTKRSSKAQSCWRARSLRWRRHPPNGIGCWNAKADRA